MTEYEQKKKDILEVFSNTESVSEAIATMKNEMEQVVAAAKDYLAKCAKDRPKVDQLTLVSRWAR